MSASDPSGGRIAAENELLAQLGLPPSATPEDVDQLHLAVSQFLAAAPTGIKGWAHAQAAVLDEAYLKLTDPVGLEGSALRSPTRPPTVVPGGPATPPARRGPVLAAPADEAVEDANAEPEETAAVPVADAPDEAAETAEAEDDTDTDDMDALYASVTPGAHRDMVSGGKAPHARSPRCGGHGGLDDTGPQASPAPRQRPFGGDPRSAGRRTGWQRTLEARGHRDVRPARAAAGGGVHRAVRVQPRRPAPPPPTPRWLPAHPGPRWTWRRSPR